MRQDAPDPGVIQTLVNHIFPGTVPTNVAPVAEGVSTYVYRIHRGADTFYLRVLPEAGASFAPEVRVHTLLRERHVRVPEIVYFDHHNELLQRSVMVTTEIKGRSIGHDPIDKDTRQVLIAAGRDLAAINSIPVAGFGWIKRDRGEVVQLEAEHPTNRAFLLDHVEEYVASLREHVLSGQEIAAIRDILAHYDAWLDVEQAWLAHGDFDVTHIYQHAGRYTGIIDFGEIRGADRWYDLGHFRMHDGETLPALVLPWLLEGYNSVIPLPAGSAQRISFASLLIAIRALARSLRKSPQDVRKHPGIVSIRRDIAVLCT